MKKLLLLIPLLFCSVIMVNAEEFTYNRDYTVLVGEKVELDALTYVGGSEVKSSISYNSSLLTDGIIEGVEGENSVCTGGAESSNETTMGCISTTHNYSGISFTKPGIYEITLIVEASSLPEEEIQYSNTYTYNITYVVVDEKVETSETREVRVDELFTIDSFEIGAKLGDDEVVGGRLTYPTKTSEFIYLLNACGNGGMIDEDIYQCTNSTAIFEDIYFTKAGTYEITLNYSIKLTETVSEERIHKIKFIVKNIETVSENVNAVGIDNTEALTYSENETIATEIIVPTNNKLAAIEVSKEEFTKAEENNVSLIYEVKNEDNELLYSWSFDSEALDKDIVTNLNLYLNVSDIDKELEKTFDEKNALLITFAYHGILPGEANVKIYVGDKYKPGDVLNFYYNNEDTGKIELIHENVVVDKDGYATVIIEHCSEYVFDKTIEKILDDEPKMGVDNTYMYLLLIITSALLYTFKTVKSSKN